MQIPVDNNVCVNKSLASTIRRSQWRYGYGMSAHPTDDNNMVHYMNMGYIK